MPIHLLIGTHNPARIDMVRKILLGTSVSVVTLADLDINIEVEEDGDTTEANAVIKARFYFARSGIPTLAMDGGLRIDCFPPEKQPGVLVKRIPGIAAGNNHFDLVEYYIQALKKASGGQPNTCPGMWTASQALAVSADRVLVHTYHFTVQFTTEPRGEVSPGRALDSIMLDPATGRYYSDLPVEERPYYHGTRDFLLENLDSLPATRSPSLE